MNIELSSDVVHYAKTGKIKKPSLTELHKDKKINLLTLAMTGLITIVLLFTLGLFATNHPTHTFKYDKKIETKSSKSKEIDKALEKSKEKSNETASSKADSSDDLKGARDALANLQPAMKNMGTALIIVMSTFVVGLSMLKVMLALRQGNISEAMKSLLFLMLVIMISVFAIKGLDVLTRGVMTSASSTSGKEITFKTVQKTLTINNVLIFGVLSALAALVFTGNLIKLFNIVASINKNEKDVIDRLLRQTSTLNKIYIDPATDYLRRLYTCIDLNTSTSDRLVINVPKGYKEVLVKNADYDLYDITCPSEKATENEIKNIINFIDQIDKVKDSTLKKNLTINLKEENNTQFFKHQLEDIKRLEVA